METTDRFHFPLLVPGQAQKEVTVNESLIMIDSLLEIAVEGTEVTEPPLEKQVGQAWLVANAATGEWSGMGGHFAIWSSAGWRFHAPFEGMACWDKAAGRRIRHSEGIWRLDWPVVLPQESIPAPVGGATVDEEARQAIARILDRLREMELLDH